MSHNLDVSHTPGSEMDPNSFHVVQHDVAVFDPVTGEAVKANQYFDDRRELHYETSLKDEAYEDMGLKELAQKLGAADAVGDVTTREDIAEVLLAKLDRKPWSDSVKSTAINSLMSIAGITEAEEIVIPPDEDKQIPLDEEPQTEISTNVIEDTSSKPSTEAVQVEPTSDVVVESGSESTESGESKELANDSETEESETLSVELQKEMEKHLEQVIKVIQKDIFVNPPSDGYKGELYKGAFLDFDERDWSLLFAYVEKFHGILTGKEQGVILRQHDAYGVSDTNFRNELIDVLSRITTVDVHAKLEQNTEEYTAAYVDEDDITAFGLDGLDPGDEIVGTHSRYGLRLPKLGESYIEIDDFRFVKEKGDGNVLRCLSIKRQPTIDETPVVSPDDDSLEKRPPRNLRELQQQQRVKADADIEQEDSKDKKPDDKSVIVIEAK